MGKYCYVCKEHFKADMYHKFPRKGDTRKKWLDAFGFEEDDIFAQTTVCSKHFEDNCYHVPNELTGNKLLRKDSIPTLFLQRRKAFSPKNQIKRKLELTEESLNTEVKPLTPSDEFSTDNASYEFLLDTTEKYVLTENLELTEKSLNTEVESLTPSYELYTDNVSYEFLLDTADIKLEEPTRKKQKRWRPAHVSQVDMERGFDTPEQAKLNFNLAITTVNTLKKKIINLNRRNRALKSKVESLETCINHLKDNNLISTDAHSSIQKIVSPIIQHLHNYTNEKKNKRRHKNS